MFHKYFVKFLVGVLDAELALIRWLMLNKYAKGSDFLELILQIRQTRERIVS